MYTHPFPPSVVGAHFTLEIQCAGKYSVNSLRYSSSGERDCRLSGLNELDPHKVSSERYSLQEIPITFGPGPFESGTALSPGQCDIA